MNREYRHVRLYSVLVTVVCAFMLLNCGGCAPYVKASIGHDMTGYRGDVAHLAVGAERRWSDNVVTHCEWLHGSSPSRGAPFNNKHDRYWLEMPNCGIKIGGVK